MNTSFLGIESGSPEVGLDPKMRKFVCRLCGRYEYRVISHERDQYERNHDPVVRKALNERGK